MTLAPKRRWSFTLRELFLALTAFGFGLAWLIGLYRHWDDLFPIDLAVETLKMSGKDELPLQSRLEDNGQWFDYKLKREWAK